MLTDVLCTSSDSLVICSRVNRIFLVNETWHAIGRVISFSNKNLHTYLRYCMCYNIFSLCYNEMMKNFECVDDNIKLKKLLANDIVQGSAFIG